MTEAQLEYLAFICLLCVLAVALTIGLDRLLRRLSTKGEDVGVAIFDVDEDINRPSLAVIEAALILTTDPEGRDHLLDRWLAEKERAS